MVDSKHGCMATIEMGGEIYLKKRLAGSIGASTVCIALRMGKETVELSTKKIIGKGWHIIWRKVVDAADGMLNP